MWEKRTLNNKLTKNAIMLYVMALTKIILPLLLLPYLTRILSKDLYGTVNYVKAIMQYMQLFVDFGFMLSATKDVALAIEDKKKLCMILGEVTIARIILAFLGLIIVIITTNNISILNNNIVFVILSYIPIALSIFFLDFLFRGLEEMHVVAIRFILARGTTTLLTFFIVKSDSDLLWIPILEILGTVVAIALVFKEINNRNLYFYFNLNKINNAFQKLKESFVYFSSNIATTAFHALNTVLVGYYLPASLVADWTICLQVAMGIQAFYTPVNDAIYPYMVKKRSLMLIKKILLAVMPIIFCGSVLLYILAPWILDLIAGIKYSNNRDLLRAFIPLIIISFPTMLFGWPCLGAIEKAKENSLTTIITAVLQCAGLIILLYVDCFTLINLALLRGGTELFMFIMRFGVTYKYRTEFKAN